MIELFVRPNKKLFWKLLFLFFLFLISFLTSPPSLCFARKDSLRIFWRETFWWVLFSSIINFINFYLMLEQSGFGGLGKIVRNWIEFFGCELVRFLLLKIIWLKRMIFNKLFLNVANTIDWKSNNRVPFKLKFSFCVVFLQNCQIQLDL